MEHLCKLFARDPSRPELGAGWASSIPSPFLSLPDQIEEDKKYGYLTPHDGKLTYVLLNHDSELTVGEAREGINAAIMGWQTCTSIDFVRIPAESENPDIVIQFLSSDEDQLFRDEPNVLAYMYYPLAGNFRGHMVINSDWPWTVNGEDKDGHWIEEKTGKKVQNPDNMFQTWGLRKVVRHELGHGVYGLPHSHTVDTTMYYSYEGMSDFIVPEDESRSQAKAGKPTRSQRFINVMKNWLHLRFG